MPLPPWTPQTAPPKSIFWTAQLRVSVCFDIRRYLTDKYFDIVWGCHSPVDLPKVPVCYDISRYLTDKYFDIVWGCHPPGTPQMDPQKSIFWMAQLRVPVCYDIRRCLTDKYLTLLFWKFHNQIFLKNCWFYGRQKVLLSVTALALRRSFTGFAGKLPSCFIRIRIPNAITIRISNWSRLYNWSRIQLQFAFRMRLVKAA